jgi:hypothetical protein
MVSSMFRTYEGKVILSDFAVKDFLYEIRRSICDPVVDRYRGADFQGNGRGGDETIGSLLR